MINDNSILVPVKNLIEKNGSIANDLVLNRLSLGGNNQTFKVSTDHAHYIAKKYYIHENDQRDRLLSEFSFLTFANQEAPNYVPDIYGKDINERIALYQFIPGKDFKDQKIVERHIESAIDFFRCINRDRKKGLSLPVASEACFSLFEHMRIIERRLQQIESILPVNEFASQALIIAKDLKVCWEIFCKSFLPKLSLEMFSILEDDQRCISPSDFGFHNAILQEDGKIIFIDFEYAGWDDPAKMIGDFFSQIAVPVPENYFDMFSQRTLYLFPRGDSLMERAKILRIAYQVKWICIILNVFLPQHLARRKFADPRLEEIGLFENQLKKAKDKLTSLKELGISYGIY